MHFSLCICTAYFRRVTSQNHEIKCFSKTTDLKLFSGLITKSLLYTFFHFKKQNRKKLQKRLNQDFNTSPSLKHSMFNYLPHSALASISAHPLVCAPSSVLPRAGVVQLVPNKISNLFTPLRHKISALLAKKVSNFLR